MYSCTFFGHSDINEQEVSTLKSVLVDLVKNKKVDIFYVGVEGRYDSICYRFLKDLRYDFPKIRVFRDA